MQPLPTERDDAGTYAEDSRNVASDEVGLSQRTQNPVVIFKAEETQNGANHCYE